MISGRADTGHSSVDTTNNAELALGVNGKPLSNQENIILNHSTAIHTSNEVGGSTQFGVGPVSFDPMNQASNFETVHSYSNAEYNNYDRHMQSGRADHSQNDSLVQPLIRNQINSSNMTMNNFQSPFSQGPLSLGMNITAQGPLLSNGSYATLNQIHPHNLTSTEPFVAVQPQNIVHSQYLPSPATSSSITGNPSSMTNAGLTSQHNRNLPPSNQSENRGSNIPPLSVATNNDVHAMLQPSSQYMTNRNAQMTNVNSQQIPLSHVTNNQVTNSFPIHSQQQMYPPTNNIPNSLIQGQPTHHSQMNQSTTALPGRSTMPKGWHNPDHSSVRESMAEEIVKLLKSRKPNAGENWQEKLPHMAKRLEDALYFDAPSYEDYADKTSLKHRLQQLALSMGSSKSLQPKAPIQNNIQPPMQQPIRGNQFNQLNHGNYLNQNNFPQPPNHMASHVSQQIPQHLSGHNGPQAYQHQQQFMQRVPHSTTTSFQQQNVSVPNSGLANIPNQVFHPSSIDYSNQIANNVSRNAPNQNMMNQNAQVGLVDGVNIDGNVGGMGINSNLKIMTSGMNPQHQVPNLTDPASNMMNHYPRVSLGMQHSSANALPPVAPQSSHSQSQLINNNHQAIPQNPEEHRKQVLKQQQQRLLLLRHASKCPHENGRCPVTPHCWNMKQLWKHIMSCKDQECKVPHCVSSRYVLSHYSKCKEPTCPVCGPVREAIKRNYERSRNVVDIVRKSAQPIPISIGATTTIPNGNSVNVSNIQTNRDEPPTKKQRTKRNAAEERLPTNVPVSAAPTIVIRPQARKIYPLDPISSAVYSFTNEQIAAHFKSIHEGMKLTVAKIKEMCKPIVEDLFKIQHAQAIFGSPVDPLALGLLDYFSVVKLPMDLGTIVKKLDSGSYRDLNNFVFDVHLTFDNAMLYNPKNTDVHCLAKNLRREFDSKFRVKANEFEKIIDENRKNKEACLICGELSLKYEPPVYYCSGTCGQRIRRNAVFYANTTNSYHWCSPCFNNLKENDVIRLPDCTVTKSELTGNKKKHTEESEEGWVECEGGCRRWVHQICSLFNNRRNVSEDISYVCPLCLQDKRKKSTNEEIVATTTKKMRAADLPVTTLSSFIERRIMKRLEIAYEEYAEKLGLTAAECEKCPPLTLRQVSCLDKLQAVREGVYNRYKEKGYPQDFSCRTKCLVLFQNIDGQDVILFGMYVYEYGHKCPQPNQRRVYVSYLDSVHYLRPKQYRTIVYHEILISYLDYVKARGFHTAHIWACPPQKGDDYILYVHPTDQKTPKPQILRIWYDEMLKRCIERGVVCEVTDLHAEFLSDPTIEATTLPYFEGDYWVNEAEVIIKNLGDGKREDITISDENGGNKSKRKKSKRPAKSWTYSAAQGERDPLMAKLASIIEPMKDTFFVARLHPREFADKFAKHSDISKDEQEKVQSEKALQEEALSAQDVVPQMPDFAENQAVEDSPSDQEDQEEQDDFAIAAANITSGVSDGEDVGSSSASAKVSTVSKFVKVEQETLGGTILDGKYKDESIIESKESSETPSIVQHPSTFNLSTRKLIMSGEDMPNLPDDTEDVDDTQECEHFDTRQSFLNLCQGNHYQFDQLRRAKHSSMMVLYHLHNPDAPKFVPTCSSCHIDILGNCRYRCEKCEIDYCQSCYSKIGAVIHSHPLRPVSTGAAPTMLTEEQRRERQRSIQLHMQLLTHAANCIKCESKNCMKMKEFLAHEAQCKIKANGGCRLCSRISNLLNIHARSCRMENCQVPYCMKLREQHRQLALSQQRMDDRRRIKMNSEYNRSTQQVVEDDD